MLKEAKKLASFFCVRTLLSLQGMNPVVKIEELLAAIQQWHIIDVRSPLEYQAGHIPGAINLPLFTDEERACVGTLYTQTSPEAALKEGLAIVGPKMTTLLEALKPYHQLHDKKIIIHCWRGGQRSKALEWFFNFCGIPVYRLEGGYKSFRQEVHEMMQRDLFSLRILGGCTGAGKTEILEVMARHGAQTIDLEKLAHHKGSAFGSIGEEQQPTTEQFENNLFLQFRAFDPSKPVWLENESKSIGRVHIPDGLWHRMRASVLYAIEVDKEIRLQRALRYYCEPVNIELLKEAFVKISKRLDGLQFKQAMEALERKDLRSAAEIALMYYDKTYTFQLNQWPKDQVITVEECDDVETAAMKLMSLP